MEIELLVNDKPVKAILALPEGGKGPGILLLHAWWGLKPFFKTLCERLAQQGYVVLAPDLNNGEVVETVDAAEELMGRRDYPFLGEVVMAAKDALLAHPACSSQKLGVIGFSMGAAWALSLAGRTPEQVAATVLYYGLGEADFGKTQSKVLGHFSDVDAWEPLEGVQYVEQSLRAAGVEVTFHMYPGKSHWFVEEDRPEYDAKAAGLAWERTLAFFKENV